MKLHLGCGTVYLDGFINIDGKPDHFSKNCDSRTLKNISTTFNNYYKYEYGKGPNSVIADLELDISKSLPFNDNSVEEIVMFHVLEHFQSYNVESIVKEIFRVLEPNGSFFVAVPDLKETAKLLINAKTEEEEDWAIRLIHGTQRNEYAHHYCGYTKRTLKNLLKSCGFTKFEDMPNLNFYPAIHMKAIKEK